MTPLEGYFVLISIPEGASELLASLGTGHDVDSEAEWRAVIERRSEEIKSEKVACDPVLDLVQDIQKKLKASG